MTARLLTNEPLSGREQKVAEEISNRRGELVELLRTLVSFDTTASTDSEPRQDAALQGHLAERLTTAGLEVDVWEPSVDELPRDRMRLDAVESLAGRPQLVARASGAGGGRSLLLNGHIDVVSAEPVEAWTTPPFDPSVRDNRLYGRGACDMKAGVAAMILAAEVVVSRIGLAGELIVNTVTDEESTGAGSVASLSRVRTADAGIIPEPTGLEVWPGCRGSLMCTITIPGRAGHAGINQRHPSESGAVNAIEKAGVVLEALRGLGEEWRTRPDVRHPLLLPGGIVPVAIEAGQWMVSYPAQCTLRCHVQYTPGLADQSGWGGPVEDEIEQCIRAAANTDPWLRIHPPTVTWHSDGPPAFVAADEPIVETVLGAARALGHDAGLTSRTTYNDQATFTRAGIPTIDFGPGDIDSAHTVDENVALDELVLAAQSLAVCAMRFCGTPT